MIELEWGYGPMRQVYRVLDVHNYVNLIVVKLVPGVLYFYCEI